MKIHCMALTGTILLGLSAFHIPSATAQTAQVDASLDASKVVTTSRPFDPARLIGQDVVDPHGRRLGEIQSVIVGPTGKAEQVVLDIGGWLEPFKRISVPWSDLKTDAAGQISSTLTRQAANQMKRYSYTDFSLSGTLIAEDGTAYVAPATAALTQQ